MWFHDEAKFLRYNSKGLIPAVIQDAETGRVLMFVYLNKDAVKKSKKTRSLYVYNRAKKKIWKKGSHSGHTMKVVEIYVHHDRHVLLIQVIPNGPACHTGNESCFAHSFLRDGLQEEEKEMPVEDEDGGLEVLKSLFRDQKLASEVEIPSEVVGEPEPSVDSEEGKAVNQGEGVASKTQGADFLEKLFEKVKLEYTEKKRLLPELHNFGEQSAQKVGERALKLLTSVLQNNKAEILSIEADILHELLVLLADQQLEIQALKEQVQRRVL